MLVHGSVVSIGMIDGVLKFLPCEEDAAFHRADWQAHVFRNFLVFVALHKKQEGFAVDIIEPSEDAVQFQHHHVGVGAVVNGVVFVDEDVAVGRFGSGVPVFLFAVDVDERVPHDGGHPSPEIGADLKFLLVVVRSHRSFLDEVFSVFEIVGQSVSKVQQLRLQASEMAVEFDGAHKNEVFVC